MHPLPSQQPLSQRDCPHTIGYDFKQRWRGVFRADQVVRNVKAVPVVFPDHTWMGKDHGVETDSFCRDQEERFFWG